MASGGREVGTCSVGMESSTCIEILMLLHINCIMLGKWSCHLLIFKIKMKISNTPGFHRD